MLIMKATCIIDNDILHLQPLLQNLRRPGRVPWPTSTLNTSFSHFLLIDHGNSGLGAGVKWRPEPSELPEFGPEFKELWDAYFANAPDKPVLWMGVIAAYVFMLALRVSLHIYTLQCI
jgi:hypothetical protein